MKKIIFTIIFTLVAIITFFSTTSFAKNSDVLVELGETYNAKQVKEKIWIENQKIFNANTTDLQTTIQPIHVGKSVIKIDQNSFNFFAVPRGTKHSYEFWKKETRKIAFLSVEFCENSVCLKGKISTLDEFIKIQTLMSENQASIFLKLDVNNDLKTKIKDWYNMYLRNHEITPPKILFEASPWKVSLSSKDESIKNKEAVQNVGLFTDDNKNKLEINDNVKVTVQFIEVKKSLLRNLGIEWPQSISGQISNTTFEKTESLIATLNASEASGESKIIASPNLVCRSGKEAEFWAGGEFPIRVSTSSKNRDIVWKKYGIQLRIKPLIDPLGQMSIDMSTEVSMPSTTMTIDGVPGVTTNRVSSHFDLISKRTIVVSGLIQTNSISGKNGLPFLTQIPYIGSLFSSQSFLDNQTELIILVTPQLYE